MTEGPSHPAFIGFGSTPTISLAGRKVVFDVRNVLSRSSRDQLCKLVESSRMSLIRILRRSRELTQGYLEEAGDHKVLRKTSTEPVLANAHTTLAVQGNLPLPHLVSLVCGVLYSPKRPHSNSPRRYKYVGIRDNRKRNQL